MYRILLLTLLWTLPARADEKAIVQTRLTAFVTQFKDTAFGGNISLVEPNDVVAGLQDTLDVAVNPNLTPAGKHTPHHTRWLGGTAGLAVRNDLLEVRSLQATNADDDLTTWHEFLHHLISLRGGYPCGPEEAYTDINERRVAWLFKVKHLIDLPLKGEIGHFEVQRRWKALDQEYREGLGGSYTWRDPDATCGTPGQAYEINQIEIADLDAKTGIKVPLAGVRASYPRVTEPVPARLGGKWCRQGREGHAGQHEVTITQTEEGIGFGGAFVDRDGTEGDLLNATTVLLKRSGPGDLTYTAHGAISESEIRWDNGDVWKRMGPNETCASAALVTWIGTYVSGRAKTMITGDTSDSIQATDFWSETDDMKPHAHRSEGTWHNCKKTKADEVECSWTANYTDPDKDMARSGTLKATLSGNDLHVVAKEDEPRATWRAPKYESAMKKDKVWDTMYRRAQCGDATAASGC